jgi:hypothetical protein
MRRMLPIAAKIATNAIMVGFLVSLSLSVGGVAKTVAWPGWLGSLVTASGGTGESGCIKFISLSRCGPLTPSILTNY